jgi:hypothetical protein
MLAWHLLENSGIKARRLPRRVRGKLAGWLKQGEEYEELRFCRSSALLSELKERGVRCVLLKGPDLARCFPHPELRRYKDLDIFAPEEDLAKIKVALLSIGFRCRREDTEWRHGDTFAYHWPPYWHPEGELFSIEIHDPRHHSGGYLGLIDTTEWLELAEPAIWQGIQFLALPKELSLLYACTHAHRHQFVLGGPRRLKNALDLYLLISSGINWEIFLDHYRRYLAAQKKVISWWAQELKHRGLSQGEENGSPLFDWADLAAHVHYGLALARDIYGAAVPQSVMAATFPKEPRLLDVGLICEEGKEKLFLWQIPPGGRFLEHAATPVKELIASGILQYWRQLPSWTSLDDILHCELWGEICRQAPRIRPD